MKDSKVKISLNQELNEMFKIKFNNFKNTFGREPNDNDPVFYEFINRQTEHNNKIIRTMRNSEVVEEQIIYAFYITGRILTKGNIKYLSKDEINEWSESINEYNNLLEEPIEANKYTNLLKIVTTINNFLKDLCESHFRDIDTVFSVFINNNTNQETWCNKYEINNFMDYVIFCIYKTKKDIETLEMLIKEGLVENAFATVRFIFETYINLAGFRMDKDLFKEKILPLAGVEKGTHCRLSKNKVKDLNIGKVYDISVKIKDLATKSGNNNIAFYNILYSNLSQYIHVDIFSTKKYFSEPDPFYDIDECFIVGIFSLFFCLKILEEVIELNIEGQLLLDIKYFINKLKSSLILSLGTLNEYEMTPIYSLMLYDLE